MDTVWFGMKLFLGFVLGALLLWALVPIVMVAGAVVSAIGESLTGRKKKAVVQSAEIVRDPAKAKYAGWCADCGIIAENDVGELWHGLVREAGVCRKCQEYRLIRAARAK
jgi:hypothetical protein